MGRLGYFFNFCINQVWNRKTTKVERTIMINNEQ